MVRRVFACLVGVYVSALIVSGQAASPASPQSSSALPSASAAPIQARRAVLDQYCVGCHNQKAKTGGLSLDQLDLAHVGQNAEVWEKVVRKLRAGMMPPAGVRRPDAPTYEALTVALEDELDRAAAANPKLTTPGVHRLNRTEYANAIHEILGLDIEPAIYLPADDSSYGFDNVESGLQVSPALVEGYVTAAAKLSRLALGHEMAPTRKVYNTREDYSQEDHVEGLPFGTRGGLLLHHYFPADGDYTIAWLPIRNTVGSLYGGESEHEQVELTIDGERIKLWEVGKDIPLTANVQADKNEVRVSLKAGDHAVGVTFIANTYIPQPFLNRSYKRSILDDNPTEGFWQSPQISQMVIQGPIANVTPPKDTASRKRILICSPTSARDELPCAKTILDAVARKAYRRPIGETDSRALLAFYEAGRKNGTFEDGIERGLQFVLAHPEFVFRTESAPATVKAGDAYRVNDLELASRLSFFLWSAGPDEELITVASQGKLKDPATLERETRRMLADPRSEELVKNFAGQWLGLRTMLTSTPEGTIFPDFDDNLRQAMRTEAEMFFDSIVHEDRNVLDLLTADYTFVNERLAAHYGIANVYGTNFRRVKLDGDLDVRRGLLGKGAVELVTSNSDRTSPVLRGKWVMENMLGTHPPDPPPNVPPLKPNPTAGAVTLRQRMEEHRSNPACASCHKMMDPIGFALENFDGTGKWRTEEAGQKLDASGQLVDGTKIDGVVSLRQALVRYSPQFLRVVTEKLLTYALGRGVEYSDMPTVRAIVRNAGKNDNRFSAIVLEIVKSAPFQMNRKPEGQLTARKN
jgi:cytochrome c551/c552